MDSISENNGIALLSDRDLKIYCVGISTGGSAEIRMAKGNPKRKIIATTIDPEGARFAETQIKNANLSSQIEVKIEDVAKQLPYPDEYFDFVYARLVLHYLANHDLNHALQELHRVLKSQGKIFIVVRSEKTTEASIPSAQFDPNTGFTIFDAQGSTYKRRFHNNRSIQEYLISSGFRVHSISSYEEQLYIDFQRTNPSQYIDILIEVVASVE